MSEQLALLGTSADPPTLGHQALLQQLLLHYPRVITWASDNPGKRHGAPLGQRAQLLSALVRGLAEPRLEHVQDLSSPYAITTLERAAARWPGAELVFVVGSDLAPQIPQWRQAAEVLKRCRLAVVPRVGWPLNEATASTLRQLGARLSVLPLPVPASASSALREQPDPTQIPRAVWPLVREHNLYGLDQPHPAEAMPPTQTSP
jgi:nicotinate-nucleotide adenylyltransferase